MHERHLEPEQALPWLLVDELDALLDKETLDREELDAIIGDVEPDSRSSETVGTVRVVSSLPAD